jgi:beta-lactamase regulating signal transducer with metallopeptidase domain
MLIQSSVLILVLWLLDLVLRHRVRAVVRYWIWLLILVKLVLPPSLSSPTSLVSWIGGRLPAAATVTFVSEPPVAVQKEIGSPVTAPMPTGAPPLPQATSASPAHETLVSAALVAPTWQAMALLAWVAVVIIMLVLLIQRAFFVLALIAQSQEAPEGLRALLESCRRHMGVRGVVGVRLSSLSAGPSVCSLRRPVILMPEPIARQLETRQLRSVLFHELAHIKRGDLWINLVQTLLQIAYLYHPLLWLANVQIRRIREQAVDEAVLAALGEDAEDYPRTLLSISKLAFGRPALSLRLLGVVESKRALAARIRRMVSRPFPKSARLGALGLAAIVLTAIVLLPMARGREGGAQDPSQGKPASSVAAWRGSVTVELLGLRAYPGTGKPWWRADGTPVAGESFPEFQTRDPAYNDPNARVRVMAFRLAGASLRDVTLTWSLTNARESSFAPAYEDADRRVLRPVQILVARFADEAVAADLKIGIGVGVWKGAAAAADAGGRATAFARDNITQSDVIYHPAQERDGSLHVTATHLLGRDYDCRIVAEDGNHNVLEPARYNNSGDKMRLCTSVLNVPLAQVKWFRLQARPYEWIEIKNIHLTPDSQQEANPAGPSLLPRGTQTTAKDSPAARTPAGVVVEEQGTPVTAPPAAQQAGGAIAGVVLDPNGRPIAKAVVTLENKDLLLLPQPVKLGPQMRQVIRPDTTQTEAQGRFRFPDLTPGQTELSAAAPGYRTAYLRGIVTGSPAVTFVLHEPCSYRLSGMVADISCHAVAGVEVTFLEETLSGPGRDSDGPPVTMHTDATGLFRLDRLLPPAEGRSVRRWLYARKPGYGAWGTQLDTTGGQTTVLIKLMAEEKVTGVVKDEAGAPIAGATVMLSSGWGRFGSFRFAPTWRHLAPQTMTQADGSFTLGQLPTESDLSLQVRAEGFVSGGLWPVRTGKFSSYAIRRGDTTTIMGSAGDPNAPLTITLPESSRYRGVAPTAAVPEDRQTPLPPGATVGVKTQWPVSEGGNGHFYQAVRMPKPLPWKEADRLAKLLSGHLVTITSEAENNFVFRLIDDDTYWYHSYNWRGPWIGAVQPPGSVEPAGGWSWVTGESFTYARWDAQQPNNFNGTQENRLVFGNQRARIPTWNDVVEDFPEVVSFVVEWDDPPAGMTTWPVSQGGNGHSYRVVRVPEGLTWDQANEAAQAQGGYLATITSAGENAFVFSLMQDPLYWNGPRGPWLGGYQTPGHGLREGWVWVTGEPFVYSPWSPGQPNDAGGVDETRLEYGWGAATPADTWNDQPDWFRGVPSYVVERDPSGPTRVMAPGPAAGATLAGR